MIRSRLYKRKDGLWFRIIPIFEMNNYTEIPTTEIIQRMKTENFQGDINEYTMSFGQAD